MTELLTLRWAATPRQLAGKICHPDAILAPLVCERMYDASPKTPD